MPTTLYHFWGSYCSGIVRIALEEKGVAWKGKIIKIGLEKEQYKPSFARINPKLVVPVLVHNGAFVTDRSRIIRYIDKNFSGSSLVPELSDDCAEMEKWLDLENSFDIGSFTYANLPKTMYKLVVKDFLARKALAKRRMDSNPELRDIYEQKLTYVKGFESRVLDPNHISDVMCKTEGLLDTLEAHIKDRKYLAGDNFSLADIVWLAMLTRISVSGYANWWENGKRPAIASYFKNTGSRASLVSAKIVPNRSFWGKLSYFNPIAMLQTNLLANEWVDN